MKTAKGTEVFCVYIEDVEPNKGGFYVEIYLDLMKDPHDWFCIHPGDCDCTDMEAVEKVAKDYVSQITEY